MRIKIVNTKLDDYGNEFKVRRMNFNQIVVNYSTGTGLKSFSFEDVECSSENEIDDFLINNRQFLKIKLKRGISVVFYSALKDSLENEIGGDVRNLNILRDKYTVNKRGIWEKEITMLVNKIFPLEITASGQNFKKDSYNIIITKIEKENFIEFCRQEIYSINKEIKQKNVIISGIVEAMEYVKKQDAIPKKLLV